MAIIWDPYMTLPPPSDADIAAYGAATDIDLPTDYTDCLRAHIGAVPEPGTVRLRRGTTPFGPLYFLDAARTHPKQSYNAYHAWDRLAEWQRLRDPSDGRFVPIATNTATGVFCFDRQTSAPHIAFVDLTYDPDEDGAIQTLATSFGDLLVNLHP